MGSRRGKEGLLLAVFWVVAIALIGTAANRLILHGPVGETLQKRETGWMLLELSVLFLWNLWWLCLAVKHRLCGMGKHYRAGAYLDIHYSHRDIRCDIS